MNHEIRAQAQENDTQNEMEKEITELRKWREDQNTTMKI